MPIDLYTKNTHDLVRTNGISQITNKHEEIVQRLINRLSTRKGEYFLDTEYGLDWDLIFPKESKTIRNEDIALAVRECLFQDLAIKEIQKIKIKKENNKIHVNFQCTTEDGEIGTGGVEIG